MPRTLEYLGRALTPIQWSRVGPLMGLPKLTVPCIRQRMKMGWSAAEILTTPKLTPPEAARRSPWSAFNTGWLKTERRRR